MCTLTSLFVLVIILSESTSIEKSSQNIDNLQNVESIGVPSNYTKIVDTLTYTQRNRTFSRAPFVNKSSSLKSCAKKRIRYLKTERAQLQILLKDKSILRDKIQVKKARTKLNKLKLHLKKCRMKKKYTRKRSKHKSFHQAITQVSSNVGQNDNDDFKPLSDDYTRIDTDKLNTTTPNGVFGEVNDLMYNTSEDLVPTISIYSYNSTLESKHYNSNLGEEINTYDTNKSRPNNEINYADLMIIKTTTLPPLKNINLNKILNEFNAINNEIREIIPSKSDYYKAKIESIKKIGVNRCKTSNGGCQHKCRLFGIQKCSCLSGFNLINIRKCLDINECVFNNGGCDTFCHNTPGSYYCSCKKGFRLADNQKTCIDINECLLRNGHGPCQDTCINTFGSYDCSCSGLSGTRLSDDKHSCQDIDECLSNKSGCSHYCINTLGRAYCTCPGGMTLGSDWKTCTDVNECLDEEVNKHCKYGCINTIGSFRCANNYELQSDQMVPDLVVCPKLYPPKLGFLECSRKKSLSISLRSKSGRKRVTNRPGTFCQLVCPDDYEIEGIFKITCGYDGEWFGERSGICKKET